MTRNNGRQLRIDERMVKVISSHRDWLKEVYGSQMRFKKDISLREASEDLAGRIEEVWLKKGKKLFGLLAIFSALAGVLVVTISIAI